MKNILKILILLLSINLFSCNKSTDSKSESESMSEEIVIQFDKEKENFSEVDGILFYKGDPFTGSLKKNSELPSTGGSMTNGFYNDSIQENITYKYGKMDGEYKSYSKGKIYNEGFYLNGKKEGEWKLFHENGLINEKGSYIEGERDGVWEYFYPSGKLNTKTTYKVELHKLFNKKISKKNGPYEEFYPNGNPRMSGKFENGNQIGEWKIFNEDGKPIRLQIYSGNGMSRVEEIK